MKKLLIAFLFLASNCFAQVQNDSTSFAAGQITCYANANGDIAPCAAATTTISTLIGAASKGTKFTISGCSTSATTGGATAGTYTSGTTGTCTVTITLNGATGLTAPNGWTCWANDETTPADKQTVTGSNTTTVTISGTTVSGDVIYFGCMGY